MTILQPFTVEITIDAMKIAPAFENKKIIVIANCDEDRPHLQKLLSVYERWMGHIQFIGWDRRNQKKDRHDSNISYRYIQRGWGYANNWLLLGLPLWALKVFFFVLRTDGALFHVIDFDSALPTLLAAKLKGKPVVYDIRDNFSLRHNWPAWLKRMIEILDTFLIMRSDKIIVVDESRIEKRWNAYKEKFVILYNAPPDVPKPQNYNSKNRPFTVYTSGYLTEVRGIKLLLQAAEQLPDIKILMAGRFINRKLENLVLNHPQVDFRGWMTQADSLALCHEADVIFAFYDPKTEINRKAASNKWFDAMMAGKPILVNQEVLKSTWIKQKDIGYTCPYGDVSALVDVLREIRSNPLESERKGARGRALFEQQYNWDAMAIKLKQSVSELIE